MHVTEAPLWLTSTDLVAPVSAATGDTASRIADWTSRHLPGGKGEGLGVWRITGEAIVNGAAVPFTVILKGWPSNSAGGAAEDWNWAPREAHAYASGDLDALPGEIHAPRCLGEVTRPDGSIWVWLSPMSEGALETWDISHFALVARHLGAFNGFYLTQAPLPTLPWLSRQWTRQWVEAAGDAMRDLANLTGSKIVDSLFPEPAKRDLQRLWAERGAWLQTIEALPHTFCHLDAFRRNVFLRPSVAGDVEIGLIDWGFAGTAAVGEEIGPLVAASLYFAEAQGIDARALDAAVFESYMHGLRDAGWNGDEALVRAGYTGSVALRYLIGTTRILLPLILDEATHPRLEHFFHMPMADLIDLHRDTNLWLLDRAHEFRQIQRALTSSVTDAA
jgi:hypothetical protein